MDLTDVIGPMGRHQQKTFLLTSFRSVGAAFLLFSAHFSLLQVDHWCSPPANFANLTTENWKNCCIPRTGPHEKYSKCEYFTIDKYQSNISKTCKKWTFDQNYPYKSIREEYELVCSRGWYVSLVYFSFTLGNMISNIPTGQIADRYGRKPTAVIGAALCSIIGVITYFSNSLEYFIITRFFAGAFLAVKTNPTLCLLMEVLGPNYRKWIIAQFSGVFGLAMILMAGLGYYIKDWRYIMLISSFPIHLPMLVLFWKFIPESSRWLLVVKRHKEAEKQIILQAKENGITLNNMDHIMSQLKQKIEKDHEKQGQSNFLHILKDKYLLMITVIAYTCFFFNVFSYHGFVISIGHLGGSFHFNFFCSGLTKMLTVPVIFLCLLKLSRKQTLLLSTILSGVLFLLTIPVTHELTWVRVLIAMLGHFFNCVSFTVLYLYTMELYPTGLRTVGVCGAMTAGRIGSLLGSFTDDLGRVYGSSFPLTIYGVLCLFSGIILLFLPETTGRHLPDSVTETKMLSQKVIQLQSTVEQIPFRTPVDEEL